MLVVDSVIPDSSTEGMRGEPAEGLQNGDVVVRLQGKFISHFQALESILDDAVGTTVSLDIERGGCPMSLHLQVSTATLISYIS